MQIEKYNESLSPGKELKINPKYSDACDFEDSVGCRMVAALGFKLFHACVIDPEREELHRLIGNKSLSEVTEFLVSDRDQNATDEEIKQH